MLKVNLGRLGLGLLLSMSCVLTYVALFVKLASGLMGPSHHASGIGMCVLVVAFFLLFIDTGIVAGLYWLRWFYCLVHFALALGTLYLLPVFLPALMQCDMLALVCGAMLVLGLALGPFAAVLIATSVQSDSSPNEENPRD